MNLIINHLPSRTMPPCTIIPVLMYRDVAEAIAWPNQVFGFTERWRVENHRAQLTLGEDTIAISEYLDKSLEHCDLSAGHKPMVHSMLIRVADVAAHYDQVKKTGARIKQHPADFPYGERQYSVQDIGGHIWTFSQTIIDIIPEDWGGTTP